MLARISVFALLLVAGCSSVETRFVASACSVDEPAAAEVQTWALQARAEELCAGGYDVVDRAEWQQGDTRITEWMLSCRAPRFDRGLVSVRP